MNRDREETRMFGYMLQTIKLELNDEFKKSISNYWQDKIKKISVKDNSKMFPGMNRIFRAKSTEPTETLNVPNEKRELLIEANITLADCLLDEEGKILVNEPTDRRNLLGAHFASVNIMNAKLGKPSLDNIIKGVVKPLQEESNRDLKNKITTTEFNNDNPAHKPTIDINNNFFLRDQN